MRYKAVCEELWSIRGDFSGASCIVECEEKRPTGDRVLGSVQGRETRGMRANNKNKHPRSEAREHMGLRKYVSAGISLSVDRFPFLFAARRRSSDGSVLNDAVAGESA
jgi:hypothetical protein